MEEAIGLSMSDQSRSGRLVWDASQEYIKVILEKWEVPRVFISDVHWQQVKQAGPMDPQRPLSCLFNFGRSRLWNMIGDS